MGCMAAAALAPRRVVIFSSGRGICLEADLHHLCWILVDLRKKREQAEQEERILKEQEGKGERERSEASQAQHKVAKHGARKQLPFWVRWCSAPLALERHSLPYGALGALLGPHWPHMGIFGSH